MICNVCLKVNKKQRSAIQVGNNTKTILARKEILQHNTYSQYNVNDCPFGRSTFHGTSKNTLPRLPNCSEAYRNLY